MTLSTADWRETALHSAVRPARAAAESPKGDRGDFTRADVMFTIRPNRRRRIPGRTAFIKKIGASMLASIVARQSISSHSPRSPKLGPA